MFRRGEVYYANLDPQTGTEQSGRRPVVIVQTDILNRAGNTGIEITFTTNIKRATLPSSVLVSKGEGGLVQDSVALCHQIRVIDKSRLAQLIGQVSPQTMAVIDQKLRFTLAI